MIFIKEFPGYYFEKKILYSKLGRKIKLTVLNYTKGYYLNRKFVSIHQIKKLTYYKEICPF